MLKANKIKTHVTIQFDISFVLIPKEGLGDRLNSAQCTSQC